MTNKHPPPPRPAPLATVSGHSDYVKCLTYSTEGRVLISGGLDKRIVLWDLERMAMPLMTLHAGEGRADSGSPPGAGAGAQLGHGGGGGGGRGSGEVWWNREDLWDNVSDPSRVELRPGEAAAGPREVYELCCQNKGSVYCVDASVDASLVASGGTDCMIRLLDPRAGSRHAAKVCKLDGHKDNVRCVRIDEGSTRVVS